MLPPEIVKKIKKIHIKSSRLVNTMMAGQYKSVFRGSGIEFEEVREYSPGDEVKSIDWKVSARLGRPYIKRYREERELVVILLVDMSASGNFGTTENLKRETAAETAAILAFNAIRNNDKVGAILFTDTVEKYIPPKKGASHVWRVIKEIFTFEPERTGTDIQNAVLYLGRVCRKKTVSFLISDFLDKNYAKQLRMISKKHELVGVLLSDPGDFHLPGAGIFYAQDFETGDFIELDASDENTRKKYTEIKTKEHRIITSLLSSSDIDPVEISTADSPADELTKYFRYREKRKR
ncbi:DUF58 [Desulfonema limicola]|uniref:DUF58 n=1 Tax=Desulfonema limicola TaxID=45656 RepID=A0A975GHG3_9BACT|nr:DUF58 domain-containing protein [Desulfonema limicola]QTA81284.1 DUF58 [Desulfonema limicola]